MRTVRPFNIHHAFITAEAIRPAFASATELRALLSSRLVPSLFPAFLPFPGVVRPSAIGARGEGVALTYFDTRAFKLISRNPRRWPADDDKFCA